MVSNTSHREYIEGWLGGTNPNKLLYEDVWGGVVSSCGLHDENCDFGNGGTVEYNMSSFMCLKKFFYYCAVNFLVIFLVLGIKLKAWLNS